MNEVKQILHHEEHAEKAADRTYFGFWVYLMTDLIMFAVLFAVYAVLRDATFGGPTAKELFSLELALQETLILLTSSFTCGLGVLAARAGDVRQTLIWFGITFLLGVGFLWLEMSEFSLLLSEGYSWQKSAFLSSFFALVGTHGLHIFFGLFWMALIFAYMLKRGLNEGIVRKLTLLGVFWHFLDIVWIFIFTIVYLFAVLV